MSMSDPIADMFTRIRNGAAARHASVGDRIIIMAFCEVAEVEVSEGRFRPRVMRLDEFNEPVRSSMRPVANADIVSMLEG